MFHATVWLRKLAPPWGCVPSHPQILVRENPGYIGIFSVRMRDQHITNERCAEMLGVPDWRVIVGRRSTRWLGHLARMAPTRLARQTLFGFVKGRKQKRTGRRRNLVSHARSGFTGSPKLAMRIWAHTAQDKAEWNDLCSQWSRDAPEFIVDDPQKCPICSAFAL